MEPITDKEKIETVLAEIGLNAFQLTQELNLSASTIYHVISGKNKLSMKLISKITSKYPNINKNYLIKGVGSPTVEEKQESQDYILVKKQDLDEIKRDIQTIFEILSKFSKK